MKMTIQTVRCDHSHQMTWDSFTSFTVDCKDLSTGFSFVRLAEILLGFKWNCCFGGLQRYDVNRAVLV